MQTLPAPRWDLSDLFLGLDDSNIAKTLDEQDTVAQAFAKTYRGTISNPKLDPAFLLEAIRSYERILQETSKLSIYTQLRFSVESTSPEIGAFLQKIQARVTAIQQHLIFFDVELASQNEIGLRALANDPVLLPYRHYLEQQLTLKPHRLTELEEKILADKQLTGSAAFLRLFEQELGHKTFTLIKNGASTILNESETLHLLHDADRGTRKAAAEALTSGLTEELPRLTYIFNTLIQDKRTDDRYRGFGTPEAARHLENEIDTPVVDALVASVTESYDMVHDFYTWKKRTLGYDTLEDYDRYAPLKNANAIFPFETSRDLVLKAFHRFSPTFADTARAFFDKRWIDAPMAQGKRGGAYCSYGTPDLHPYVFLNHTGSARDVLTMAHELGHAIHATLAQPRGYLQFSSPLTLAETASVFAEMVVFDDLRSSLEDPQDRLALLSQKIEEIFASVHRQIAMFQFERDVHAAAGTQGELSAETLNALWRKRQAEMFGDSVSLTNGYDVWWSYISHFYATPFYVYAYAFGELLTLSLYAHYRERGDTFVHEYISMLAAGGSQSPQTLLAPFGIRLDDPTFWKKGISLLRAMVEEALLPRS